MARLGRKAALTALWTALTATRRGGPSLGRRLAALPRMFLATITGRYDGRARLAGMTLAGVYIASPLDFIPDWLVAFFGVGLVDDAAIAVWLAGAVLSETERFLAWEAERAKIIPGRVIQPETGRASQPETGRASRGKTGRISQRENSRTGRR